MASSFSTHYCPRGFYCFGLVWSLGTIIAQELLYKHFDLLFQASTPIAISFPVKEFHRTAFKCASTIVMFNDCVRSIFSYLQLCEGSGLFGLLFVIVRKRGALMCATCILVLRVYLPLPEKARSNEKGKCGFILVAIS